MIRGEIWVVNLDQTTGAEIGKQRPALIVNNQTIGILPLKIIVPITGWNEKFHAFPWMVKIEPDPLNRLSKTSALDCFQVRSVSQDRLNKKVGEIENSTLRQVEDALRITLSI